MSTITVTGRANYVEGGVTNAGANKLTFKVGEYVGKDEQTGKGKYANYSVILVGKQVDWVAPKLSNETEVVVTGKFTPEDYVAKDGTAKTALKIMAYDVKVIGGTTTPKSAEVVYEDVSF